MAAVVVEKGAVNVLAGSRGDMALPGALYGTGWLALMFRRGKLTAGQVLAGLDIIRAMDSCGTSAACGLRAINPAKLVVDGGRGWNGIRPDGGYAGASDSQIRYQDWVREIRARPLARAVLRGRQSSLYVDVVVVKVLGGVSPLKLDGDLGIRESRTDKLIKNELEAYADRFCLAVQKIPA